MAATIGLFAASMAWIIGISGGPDILVPNSLMSAPVIKKMKLRMLSRGFKQWLQSECHGAVPFQEMRQRRDKRAHWWHFTSQSNNEIVWCGICVSIVKWHETEKKKKKKSCPYPHRIFHSGHKWPQTSPLGHWVLSPPCQRCPASPLHYIRKGYKFLHDIGYFSWNISFKLLL